MLLASEPIPGHNAGQWRPEPHISRPTPTSATVASPLSQALVSDAARARTSSEARRWIALARIGYARPMKKHNATTATVNVAGTAYARALSETPKAAASASVRLPLFAREPASAPTASASV